jgi:hypothetical protein
MESASLHVYMYTSTSLTSRVLWYCSRYYGLMSTSLKCDEAICGGAQPIQSHADTQTQRTAAVMSAPLQLWLDYELRHNISKYIFLVKVSFPRHFCNIVCTGRSWLLLQFACAEGILDTHRAYYELSTF